MNIDWNDDKVFQMAMLFASNVEHAAKAMTGFDFTILPSADQDVIEIVTQHPNAAMAEYGTIDLPGGSWSVKAMIEGERGLNEYPSGGV